MSVGFKETAAYKFGHAGELLIADCLRNLGGWFIIPSYDYSGSNEKAPKMKGANGTAYVLPDLDISREGVRKWAEVKTKTSATYYKKNGRWEHGMATRHYRDYINVQRITGCEVLVFIYESSTNKILMQKLNVLMNSNPRFYDGSKMGQGGMVFWPVEVFCVFDH